MIPAASPEAVVALDRSLELPHVLGGRALEVIQTLCHTKTELATQCLGPLFTEARVPHALPIDLGDALGEGRLLRADFVPIHFVLLRG